MGVLFAVINCHKFLKNNDKNSIYCHNQLEILYKQIGSYKLVVFLA